MPLETPANQTQLRAVSSSAPSRGLSAWNVGRESVTGQTTHQEVHLHPNHLQRGNWLTLGLTHCAVCAQVHLASLAIPANFSTALCKPMFSKRIALRLPLIESTDFRQDGNGLSKVG